MGPLTPQFLFNALSIVLIDVLLAGDNAVVIAMAVKTLPPKERRVGLAAGAAGAVVLRIVLTFFAAQILQLNYIQFIGGALVLWIAVKLLSDAVEEESGGHRAVGLWHAVWLILVADVTMSTDNILAVAAASRGSLALLIAGLALSITFVVFTSTILAGLMDRFPIIVYIGAAILGRVGGEMMGSDPWIKAWLNPSHVFSVGLQIVCTVGVLVAGRLLARRSA